MKPVCREGANWVYFRPILGLYQACLWPNSLGRSIHKGVQFASFVVRPLSPLVTVSPQLDPLLSIALVVCRQSLVVLLDKVLSQEANNLSLCNVMIPPPAKSLIFNAKFLVFSLQKSSDLLTAPHARPLQESPCATEGGTCNQREVYQSPACI